MCIEIIHNITFLPLNKFHGLLIRQRIAFEISISLNSVLFPTHLHCTFINFLLTHLIDRFVFLTETFLLSLSLMLSTVVVPFYFPHPWFETPSPRLTSLLILTLPFALHSRLVSFLHNSLPSHFPPPLSSHLRLSLGFPLSCSFLASSLHCAASLHVELGRRC